jgi:hypothetical protein
LIGSLGSIGLGLVWGFLLGKFDSGILRPQLVAGVLLAATTVVTAEVFWLAGLRATPYFLLATLTALFVHAQWRRGQTDRHLQSR